MSARMTVNRTDWGVGQGDWATGDEVALEVAIAVEIKAAAQ
jgi:polyisoprenoid-binding protein YceI